MSEALAERPQAVIHVDQSLAPITPLLAALHPHREVAETTLRLHHEAVQMRRQILGLLLAAGYDILKIERRRATLTEIYTEVTR